MDSILHIFILVAFVALCVYKSTVKQREKYHHPAAGQPSSSYPEEMTDATMPAEVKKKKKKAKAKKARKIAPASSPSIQLSGQDRAEHPVQEESIGRQIKLKKPADARRAFIYAEIFNRKYD